MKAHSISMNEYATIMFHQVSFGSGGEGWNVEKHVEHTLKSSKRLLRDLYKFFFSEQEITAMLTGTPFYMDREEFIKRYTQRAELLEADLMAKIDALEAAEEAEASVPKRKPRAKKSLALSQES